MDIYELKKQCEQRLADPQIIGSRYITLVVPWKCSGEKTRLGKNVGPYGRVVSWSEDSGCNVIFEVQKVLDFCVKALKQANMPLQKEEKIIE